MDLRARSFVLRPEVTTAVFLFVAGQCLVGLLPFVLGLRAHFVFGVGLGLPL